MHWLGEPMRRNTIKIVGLFETLIEDAKVKYVQLGANTKIVDDRGCDIEEDD